VDAGHLVEGLREIVAAASVWLLLAVVSAGGLSVAYGQSGDSSAGAASAAAPSKSDQDATELFEAARLQFKEGKYALALSLFEEAYAKSERGKLLYLIGLSAERLGRLERGISAFQGYLQAGPSGEQAACARVRVAALQQKRRALPPVQVAEAAEGPDAEASLPGPSLPGEVSAEPVGEWYRQWWVWAAAGAVLVGGATTAVLVGASEPGYEKPPLDDSAGLRVMTLRLQP